MYVSTIAQKNKFNQHKFMEDPFDLGHTGSCAVLKNKSNEANLFEFVNDLVTMYAKSNGLNYTLCVSDLSDDDKYELSKLYIEYTDREVSECVHGNDFSINNDYTSALLAMLDNNCLATRENFAEVVRNNIITYYEKSLERLLQEACMAYEYSSENVNQYYSDDEDTMWGIAS